MNKDKFFCKAKMYYTPRFSRLFTVLNGSFSHGRLLLKRHEKGSDWSGGACDINQHYRRKTQSMNKDESRTRKCTLRYYLVRVDCEYFLPHCACSLVPWPLKFFLTHQVSSPGYLTSELHVQYIKCPSQANIKGNRRFRRSWRNVYLRMFSLESLEYQTVLLFLPRLFR